MEKNGVVIMTLERGIRFPAVDRIQTVLDEKSLMSSEPVCAILDFRHISCIDYSVLEVSGVVIMMLERGIRFPAVDRIQTILDEKSLMSSEPICTILDF